MEAPSDNLDNVIPEDIPGLSDFELDALLEKSQSGTTLFKKGMREKARRVDEGSEDEERIGTLASEVKPEGTRWLWDKRIPLGEITILDGNPGTGKSTLLTKIIANLTTGRKLPDHQGPPVDGGAAYVTTEDSPSRTIQPRLKAAGANLRRVLILQSVSNGKEEDRPLTLPEDKEILEKGVKRVGARLVVIDPLVAHLGGSVDAHRDSDVRRALAPLATLAQDLDAAVVVVRHLNKSGGSNAIYRGGGSIGIIGAARVGLLLAESPQDGDIRVLASVKNNLSPSASSMAFRIGQAPAHKVGRVEWVGTVNLAADELLDSGSDGRGRPPEELNNAKDFLGGILADGPVPAQEVKRRASEEGIVKRTLERAKAELGVGSDRKEFNGPWYWIPPDSREES